MEVVVNGGNQKTILVVDDDPVIIKLVSTVVTCGSFKLLVATSGAAALQLSKGYIGEIDLLLSDFQMPEMSGIDLATQITRDRPKIKVLLMSGFPGGMLVLNEGWHFLAKPFIPSQLLTLISGLITPDKPSRFAA
jgi:two-component system cell cycle sensor histidine kinase/response regulator CckA